MSKDVIDKLIEQVLTEREFSPPVPMPNKGTEKGKAQIVKNLLDDEKLSTPAGRSLYDFLKSIANNQIPHNQLDIEDVKRDLKTKTRQQLRQDVVDSISRYKSSKKEDYRNSLFKMIDAAEGEILTNDVLEAYFKSENNEEFYKAFNALSSDNSDLKGRATKIYKELIKSATAVAAAGPREIHNKLIQRIQGKEPDYHPFGVPVRLPKQALGTTESDFKEGKLVEARQDLVDLFSSIDGDSVVKKLNSIAEFSNAVGNGEIKEWIEARAGGQFDYINYAKVLSMLADLPKEYQAIESGLQFERWLALFLNMPVVGAEGGTADNLGEIIPDGEPVFTSAKLYSNPCSASQSRTNITSHFEKHPGKSIYYFIMIKKGTRVGASSSYMNVSGLDFYLTKITEKEERHFGTMLNSSGQETLSYPLSPKLDSKSQILLLPCGEGTDPASLENLSFFSIGVLPEIPGDDETIRLTADYLADAIKGEGTDFANISKKIIGVYQNLQAIDAGTTKYSAAKSSKRRAENAQSYITEISDNYTEMKQNLNDIFRAGEAIDKDAIQESKIPLDSLIESFVKEMLKK